MWMLKDADLFQYLTVMRMIWTHQDRVCGKTERALRSDWYWGLQILSHHSRKIRPRWFSVWSYPDLSRRPTVICTTCRASEEDSQPLQGLCSYQLWVCSPSRGKDRRCSDGFTPDYLLGFTGSIKTLIIRIQKEHQRMPCNLLPPREQVAPIPLHCLDITPSFHIACWIQAGTLSAGITSAWHFPEWLQPSDNILHPF